MTKLDCTVTTCVHNAERCCCRSEILVEGVRAKNCCDTCCGSFDSGVLKRFLKSPPRFSSKLEVECDVVNCLYNDDHQCRAERIAITGDGAMAVGQTECASFREK